jgi:serine/threonine protein kinase
MWIDDKHLKDHYEDIQFVGQGSFAKVYSATDKVSKEKVAIKVHS